MAGFDVSGGDGGRAGREETDFLTALFEYTWFQSIRSKIAGFCSLKLKLIPWRTGDARLRTYGPAHANELVASLIGLVVWKASAGFVRRRLFGMDAKMLTKAAVVLTTESTVRKFVGGR